MLLQYGYPAFSASSLLGLFSFHRSSFISCPSYVAILRGYREVLNADKANPVSLNPLLNHSASLQVYQTDGVH